ncbi:hypothetical protein BJY52DRAFT_436966 [Lactarius psammicola]|nr:hypothetical protein BJY52DRAFT_436966 [Lactarius psammicola]
MLLTFILFYGLVFVRAIPFVKRIVVSPQITCPKASTTWNVGDKAIVTWDTSGIPQPSNFTGQLLLGYLTSDSENLDIDHPLAQDFLLSRGSVQITVPNVPDGNNYIVVLFGDSGNPLPQFTTTGTSTPVSSTLTSPSLLVSFPSSASPQFTITGGSSTTTTLTPSSTPTPPSPTLTTPSPATPTTPSSPTPTTPSSLASSPPPPPTASSSPSVLPTSTSTPASPTPIPPSLSVSSPSSSTVTPNSVTAAAANAPSLCLAGRSNGALPPLHARGAGAISFCATAAAMTLVLVLV